MDTSFKKFMEAFDLRPESITSRGMTVELADINLVRAQTKVINTILLPLEDRIAKGDALLKEKKLNEDAEAKLKELKDNKESLKKLIDESSKKLVDYGAVLILLKSYAVALEGIMIDGEVPKRLFPEQAQQLKQCHSDCVSLLTFLNYLNNE